MPNYFDQSGGGYGDPYGGGYGYGGYGNGGGQYGAMGTGLGDLFDAFAMGNQSYPNPAGGAQGYLGSIQGQITPNFAPYMNAGANSVGIQQGQYDKLLAGLPGLQAQYGALMNNPGGVINAMGKSFQQSPGYSFQTGQAENAANRAAAAGGMLGSPQEQQNIAGTVNGMANQDYYNYLNHAMGAYTQGLQGQQGLYNEGLQGEQGLGQMGAYSSNNLSQLIANQLMSQGSLAYAGQADQNQMQGGAQGAMDAGIGGAISSFFNL